MRKFRLAAAVLTACLIASAAAGCAAGGRNTTPSSSGIAPGNSLNAQDDLADKEIKVGIAEESAEEHETVFKLNSIIDSGERTDSGDKYVYLNVTIKNTSGSDYELSLLNNFFLLLPDGTEISTDIRTQIYAQNNFRNYTESPFTVAAGSEFTGYIGGFLLSDGVSDFTVCFFPTQDDLHNKSSIIKCDVNAADIISLPADLAG